MKVLTLDVENTMYKHQTKNEEGFYNPKDREGGHASRPQFLVMTGLKWLHKKKPETIRHIANEDFNRKYIQLQVDQANLLVGFNIKHDLLWLRRFGITFDNITIWDCQLAEWMLSYQKILGQNSLNDACARYGFPGKLDVIATEYWDKGIDTDEIPSSILSEYLEVDLEVTEKVFLKQCEIFGYNIND